MPGPDLRTLCYVTHYFDRRPDTDAFVGGSSRGMVDERKETVEECVLALRSIPGTTVEVVGIPGKTLVEPDIAIIDLESPLHLPYEAVSHMAARVDDFDYFIVVEDDVILPRRTFENVVDFDREAGVFEVLHPNRLERDETGYWYCTDLYANPTWTYTARTWRGHELREALSPHSGIAILSQEKMRFAVQRTDLGFRGVHFSTELESALANLLLPFQVFRFSRPADLFRHYAVHRDRWKLSPEIVYRPNPYLAFHDTSLSWRDFVPPAMLIAHRKLRRMLYERRVRGHHETSSHDPDRELRDQGVVRGAGVEPASPPPVRR